eukprot:1525775-Rhodomonas_salina.1
MFLRDRGHFRQMNLTAAIQTGAMCPETPFIVSTSRTTRNSYDPGYESNNIATYGLPTHGIP